MIIQVPDGFNGGVMEFSDKWKYIDYLWELEEKQFKKFHLDLDRKEFFHSSVWILAEPEIYTEYELMELNKNG